MELVEGRDLKQLLRERGGLPWEEAYDVALQVAAGLEAIHEAGIIHRDLKASNIMRDRHGVVRLMDFGIAKVGTTEPGGGITDAFPVARRRESAPAPGGGSSITGTDQVVGSPEYMSPEQVQRRPIDFRSDLYALGIVIFEVFTARVPFRGDTPAATMRKHVEEPPPLAGREATTIPEDLLAVLKKALAKDPAERYVSCREMIVALESARAALDGRVTETVSPAASGSSSLPGNGRLAASADPLPPLPPEARHLVPKLADGLRHRDAAVRARAAGMLARLGADARAATPALAAAVDDEDGAVRAAAAAALRRLAPDGGPAASPAAGEEESGARPPAPPLETPPSSPSSGPSVAAPLRPHEPRARARLAVVALLALLVVTAAMWRFCATAHAW
jgi:serine/threonine-protein kinase